MLASLLANIHRDRKQKGFTPEDFMPKYGRPQAEPVRARKQTPQDIFNVIALAARATQGKKRRAHGTV